MFDDMFSCFDIIPACDRQTDGQTSCNSIVHAMHKHCMVIINVYIRINTVSKQQQVHKQS